MSKRVWSVAAAVVCMGGPALAQGPLYWYIGVLGGQGQEVSVPTCIGPGPAVYGYNDYFHHGVFRRAYIWTPATGMDPLAGTPDSGSSSGVHGVSADGRVLLGVLGGQVFRRMDGVDQPLPLAPGMSGPAPSALSLDGAVAVGVADVGAAPHAVRWLGTGPAEDLGTLPGQPTSQAYGVSGDGSVVVGTSGQGYAGVVLPVRWADGQIESLGLPEGCAWAWARAVSADGSTIVGLGWQVGGNSRAFIWTAGGGMALLTPLPGDSFSEAWSISADGRTIGGRSGARSCVWRDGVPHAVQTELAGSPAVSPIFSLAGNVVVSPDGLTIAGTDRVIEGPGDGEYHSWAVTLPAWPGCEVDLNEDGLVDFGDYLEFLNRYDAADPRVDFNGDGLVDFSDYLEFLNLYDAGC